MTAGTLPGKAQDMLEGRAPEALRRGVAAGALPLPPAELVSCLAVIIAKDPDADLQAKAKETLQDLPHDLREGVLREQLAAPVFRVLWTYGELNKNERQALVLNQHAPDDVIAKLAAVENEEDILGIVSENQQRMLRHVDLVEALLENPTLGPATRARVEEFFSRSYADKVMLQSGQKTIEELKAEHDLSDEEAERLVEAAKAGKDEEVPEDMLATDDDEEVDEEEAQALLRTATGEDEEDEEKPQKKEEEELDLSNLRKALSKMTVPQKIKLAISGNKEARSMLVTDGNKIVSSLVLKNPRISEKEIKAIAGSKSVREDLLRQIARDKRWIKSYEIKHALVTNPKTPVAISMGMLKQLRDSDLKKLARSKSVSNNIATQAKRMMLRKQAKK